MEEERRNNRSCCCLPPADSAPWLLYTHGNSRKTKMQTFCTISSEYCFKSIPLLRGKEIFSSNGEWIVLCDVDDPKIFSLWNSISSQVVYLPPLNALDDGVDISCAVVLPSCEHDDDNFSVFLFADEVVLSCKPFRINSSWVVQSTELLGERAGVVDVVACNGIIYGYASLPCEDGARTRRMVIIEVNNGSDLDGPLILKSLDVKSPDAGFCYVCSSSRLLESCGRVYNVRIHSRKEVGRQIDAVNVWEVDLRLMKWVRLKCLNGRAFFLGNRCSTWCWGSTVHGESGGVQGNSVYFAASVFFGSSKALFHYNFEDCSLTSSVPCPNLPLPFDPPAWVMSQHQRFTVEGSGKHTVEEGGYRGQNFEATHSAGGEENEVVKGLLLCEFPVDIIAQVARQLHLFDYLKFRATCKLFNYAAPPAMWRTNNSYPLLMFFESEDPLCTLMDPCRSDSCHMVIPETFGGVVFVDFSKNGWLLLYTDGGYCLEFLNPFTGVQGKYPSFEFLAGFLSIGFSTCPTSSDCTTVGIINAYHTILVCYFTFGDEKWHICPFEQYYEDEFLPGTSSPVYFEGAFYFLDSRGYLGVFELINGEGKWYVFGKPQIPSGHLHSSHLIECDGQLLSVFIGEMGEWVRVFKLEQPKMKWAPVKSLGNHTLFIGPSSCFAALAMEQEMQNRIYLARRRGNGILFYSLETGKYSTLKGEDWMEDLSGTKEHPRCCWI